MGAQHSQDFAAWYASVPGLKVRTKYQEKRWMSFYFIKPNGCIHQLPPPLPLPNSPSSPAPSSLPPPLSSVGPVPLLLRGRQGAHEGTLHREIVVYIYFYICIFLYIYNRYIVLNLYIYLIITRYMIDELWTRDEVEAEIDEPFPTCDRPLCLCPRRLPSITVVRPFFVVVPVPSRMTLILSHDLPVSFAFHAC